MVSCYSLAYLLLLIILVMKRHIIALPIWSGKICTVLDFAQSLLVVEVESVSEVSRKYYALTNEQPIFRARRLRNLGVQILICGALSRPLLTLLRSYGITVIPYICGHVDEVVNSYVKGDLSQPSFRLPGCPPNPKGRRKHGGRWTL